MPAVNFTMFREKILSREKLHTIRRIRNRPIKVDDRLVLYWMQRTADCKKLMDTKCTAIQTFAMNQYGTMFVDGDPLNDWQAEELAIADGFKNADEMREFFRGHYGDILSGMVIIHWS
jgi:hypothetical protein